MVDAPHLQARGELPGVQHVGELGHRVRLRRVVGSVQIHHVEKEAN